MTLSRTLNFYHVIMFLCMTLAAVLANAIINLFINLTLESNYPLTVDAFHISIVLLALLGTS